MQRLPVLACLVAACAGPSPDPQRYAGDLPPERQLDGDTRRRADELGAAALSAAMAGAFAAAERDAAAALEIDPRQGQGHAALGLAAMHAAQAETPPALDPWHRAEGELLLAARLVPDDVEVLMALARFYVADGHGRAALDVLARALVQVPQHRDALRLAGVVAYEASEERLARGYLARLHALVPDDAMTLYRLASCEAVVAERTTDRAAKQQAWQHVLELCERYRGLAPSDAQGLLAEARARLRLVELRGGEADDAELERVEAIYAAAADLDPTSADAAYGRGYVRELRGDAAGAEASYRAALGRQPAHAPSLLNLAALLAARGDRAAAEELWRTALRAGLTANERRRVRQLLDGG